MKKLTIVSMIIGCTLILASEARAAGKSKGAAAPAKSANALGAKVEEPSSGSRALPPASKEPQATAPKAEAPKVEPSKASEPATEAKPQPKLVTVSIQSDYPFSHLNTLVEGKPTTVCQLPCAPALEVGKHYWVDGRGMVASETFIASEETKSFNVRGGSQVAKSTGYILLTVAASGCLAAGGIAQVAAGSKTMGLDKKETYVKVTLGTLAVSAILAIPGLILWFATGTTVEAQTKSTGGKLAFSPATGGFTF
jgi:hypothetical protein